MFLAMVGFIFISSSTCDAQNNPGPKGKKFNPVVNSLAGLDLGSGRLQLSGLDLGSGRFHLDSFADDKFVGSFLENQLLGQITDEEVFLAGPFFIENEEQWIQVR